MKWLSICCLPVAMLVGVLSLGAQQINGVVAPRWIRSESPQVAECKGARPQTAAVEFVVDRMGRPTKIDIKDVGFDGRLCALKTVEGLRYTPATRNGVPFEVKINLKLNLGSKAP